MRPEKKKKEDGIMGKERKTREERGEGGGGRRG